MEQEQEQEQEQEELEGEEQTSMKGETPFLRAPARGSFSNGAAATWTVPVLRKAPRL